MRKQISILSVVLVLVTSLTAQTAPPRISEQSGFQTVTFETPHGKVRVYLPDDMRPGDTISGSVVSYPTTSGSFEGFAIDAGGTRVQASDRFIKFMIPAGANVLPLKLVNAAGFDVSGTTIRLLALKSSALSGIEVPRLGQTGRPLEIPGAFDGDFGTTRAQVGDKPAALIAESPRKLVVFIPREPVGPTNFSISEIGKLSTREFRNIGVTLSAPKTNLAKGESTTLTMQLSGLQGITQDVPFDLVTIGTVNTEGGNSQYLRITPGQVQTDGRVTLTRTLTAVENGEFNVMANVIVRRNN